MTRRFNGGVRGKLPTVTTSSASGMWDLLSAHAERGASNWPVALAVPGAPTSVSATAGAAQATVSFTAPSFAGVPASITGYRVTSSPGGITATGASSPITITGLTNGTAYTFTVSATNSTGYGSESSASSSVTPTAPVAIYAFTTYTFTPAGASSSGARRDGPTLAQCQSAYSGSTFISSYFAVPVQGVQRLVVPVTGTYRVTAAGARGGTRAADNRFGGSGRIIVADVSLTGGDYVYILVGHEGGPYTSAGQGGGGGGGTFLSTGASWETSTLLVAAGGGGGHNDIEGTVENKHGQTGTSGGGWGGGTNGNGGTQGNGSEQGAPGGGWFSGGLNTSSYPGAQIRSASTATGAASVYGNASNVGGFGGGASGWGSSGGGGGYSGGGAQSTTSNTSNRVAGGGGGSYNTGTLVSNSGLRDADGYLTLTKL